MKCFLTLSIFALLVELSPATALAQDNVATQQSDQIDAAQQVKMPLWDGMPPGSKFQGQGDVPELTCTFVEADQPTAAIVILPGGGYGGHAIGHEGYEIAEWFKDRGVSSAICTYRLRGKGNNGEGYGHPIPLRDAQRAIQTVRANASKWNIDPERIGVIGFSAGGHLCATVSTRYFDVDADSDDPIDRVSSRPDFSILCYPVIAFGKPHTHQGSQRNLLGADAEESLIADTSGEAHVTEQTPPTFLFHTQADTVVPPRNALDYYNALIDHNVPAEMHVFPEGRHGLGLAVGKPGASEWPSLCDQWLRRLGIITSTAR
ncbi:alpha/beta hydrolase [Roseiconus lacunae]|uniref:Alpha/beta hydrolase n=1 Tax=Roseiconus lacunae TaxID=2605694 RepID=A0ABT7PD51_9BACT|nr:alpha/beta hydrolase [Roseiconus lacunae]MDM4014428.1 alpha/beta hydrolase [Roseiconus lacunae]